MTSDTVVLDCRIVITVSNLGLRGSCMYVCTNKMYECMWLNWLECAVGSEFKCGRATYISSLGQGTNIQLPLSPEQRSDIQTGTADSVSIVY